MKMKRSLERASKDRRSVATPAGIALVTACATLPGGTVLAEPPPIVEDLGVCTNFQGPRGAPVSPFFKGRMLLAGDLDRDGLVDLVFGNPGDPSFVARTTPSESPDCAVELEVVQVLSARGVYWSGGLADFDNDGDLDLFVGGGGNENAEHNAYWQNRYVETGDLYFEDVTATGATTVDDTGNTVVVSIARHSWDRDLDGNGVPGDERLATAGVAIADVDNDGWLDLFLSGNLSTPGPEGCGQPACGRNTLWLNNGDGTFTDITYAVGVQGKGNRTRHAAFFDHDDDGYPDILVSNYLGYNDIYRNMLGDTGELFFVDKTDAIVAPGEDAHFPWDSFGSRVFDVNHDGIEDFMLATHAPREVNLAGEAVALSHWVDCGGEQTVGVRGEAEEIELYSRAAFENGAEPYAVRAFAESPYPEADHALFVSGPDGFENRASEMGINQRLFTKGGVMGWQVGDLNADGIADIAMGNGAPITGQGLYLLLSDTEQPWGTVRYEDHSDLLNRLDLPRDPAVEAERYAPWPDGGALKFRGHGMVFVDVDGDGTLEVLSSNGGTDFVGDFGDVSEPNRLFKFTWPSPRQYLSVRLFGDGVTVNRDAIGTEVAVTVSDRSGTRTLYQHLSAPHAFSAQSGFDLYFGLGLDPDVAVDEVRVTWPDGLQEVFSAGLVVNSILELHR